MSRLSRYIWITAIVVGMTAVASAQPAPTKGKGSCMAGMTPGSGRLPTTAPDVLVYSFNGRVYVPPRPTFTGTVQARRGRDPMVIRFRKGVQPGSEYTYQYQGRSNKVELPKAATCERLQQLAEGALVWKGDLKVKPSVQNDQDADYAMIKEESKVSWPNSRYRLTGVTRQGNKIGEVRGVVEGWNSPSVETITNHATGQMQQFQQSGRFLPSARAWAEVDNMIISQPVTDRQTNGKGKTMVKMAARRERTVAYLNQWVQQETEKLRSGAYNSDPAKRQKMQQAVAKVQQRIPQLNTIRFEGRNMTTAQLKQTGEHLRAQGRELRSIMISVGGLPIDAQVQNNNPRLRNPSQFAQTSGTSDKSGYLKTAVGGMAQDTVLTTVAFPGDNRTRNGSRLTITHAIPDPASARPVTQIGKVKFYKLQNPTAELVNDPVPAQ
jgi:hypothetical protein